ncbi:hypothetical protein JG687_00002728 [Phytophthora cactorum]|uniref:Uncharacterized protein n=1 Tax=Phytophthora cactorum TaxID=29920 RepID=A0A8T1UWF6_9STRA|nr:hypothetical protein JG687_00002728 [Phytophthora cactorum]
MDIERSQGVGTRADQPALSTTTGKRNTADVISSTLNQAALSSGLYARSYSTHPVRIGGATEPLKAGADGLVINRIRRWLSNAFEDYPC